MNLTIRIITCSLLSQAVGRVVEGSMEAEIKTATWPSLAKPATVDDMRVNVGQAKTDLSKLLARVEAGEDVEIARDGVPVAKLVRAEREMSPGERFLATAGRLSGQIEIPGESFEFSEEEIDQWYVAWGAEDDAP
jgi:prevent-host-death family protein